MKDPTQIIKHRIAQFLNKATAVVVHSYERYLSSDIPEELDDPSKLPDQFKKFHDAGKSAASHLESLMKLANAAHDPQENEKAESENKRLEQEEAMRKAKAELDGGVDG